MITEQKLTLLIEYLISDLQGEKSAKYPDMKICETLGRPNNYKKREILQIITQAQDVMTEIVAQKKVRRKLYPYPDKTKIKPFEHVKQVKMLNQEHKNQLHINKKTSYKTCRTTLHFNVLQLSCHCFRDTFHA